MTKVYSCLVQKVEADLFHDLLLYVDVQVKDRIYRYKRKEDQVRTLLAHALSKMMLAKELQTTPSVLQYKVNKYGKYELDGHPLCFNLSHAQDYVVCAISKKQVGVDIEKCIPRDFQLFTTVWSKEEKTQFNLRDHRSFYRLWTAKESYVKYLGIGLHACLTDISVDLNGSIMYQRMVSAAQVSYVKVHEDYVCAVCSEEQIEGVEHVSVEQIAAFFREDL